MYETCDAKRIGLPRILQEDILDACFAPVSDLQEGRAALHHIFHWTVLSFWDRSVDPRPGSHSTFILFGILTFEAAVAKAKSEWPEVWKRYTFTVTEIKT
jgi:hypothetical protein